MPGHDQRREARRPTAAGVSPNRSLRSADDRPPPSHDHSIRADSRRLELVVHPADGPVSSKFTITQTSPRRIAQTSFAVNVNNVNPVIDTLGRHIGSSKNGVVHRTVTYHDAGIPRHVYRSRSTGAKATPQPCPSARRVRRHPPNLDDNPPAAPATFTPSACTLTAKTRQRFRSTAHRSQIRRPPSRR